MSTSNSIRRAVRYALLTGAAAAAAASALPAQAQDQTISEIVVTGTRITTPNAISSSPIFSIGADEIQLQQQPEVEKILRVLPITFPDDGQNVNNGTDGAAVINLRNLGAQRSLVLVNGKRLTPYDDDGIVDTSQIPTALIERIDIVTGGASAVYGSDAVAGAINFVLKDDFEGVEIDTDFSQTEEEDGETRSVSLTMGANVADGRGNIVLSINWADREGVQLGARPLGVLGIETATGAGYAQFLAGQGPPAPPAGCGGPGAAASGGSSTTLPTRVAIAGGPGLGQFRNDGTLGTNCSVFNFNPFNYYQTPMERFGGNVIGSFEVSEHAEAYARFAYSSTNVRQQIAPSGIFGTAMWTPLANPFISAQARTQMISVANTGRVAGTVVTAGVFPNWRDVNANGVVDDPDYLNVAYRRRTVEFGERSTTFDANAFHFIVGAKGDIVGDWNYDVSLQYGESDRTNLSAGYTNVTNVANALDTVNGVDCANGDPTCVPINMFGGFGSITPAMAAYSSASAIIQQGYEQQIVSGSVSGPINVVQIPWASSPLAVSFGAEYREEEGRSIPDECWKLAPSSCLGGAGGNQLPIEGAFDVSEVFGEALLPIVNNVPGFHSLDVELGYRYSDYNLTGTDETYKYGLSWRPIEQVLVRVMKQRAARAPNIGELAAPQVTALDNATMDPCSEANATELATNATLRALCISTGMTAAQVGVVEDIVVGQINTFQGTDLANLPEPEKADTLTVGLVWTPDFGVITNPVFSIDYYDIDVKDWIDEFTPQDILDGCYVAGIASECAKIVRIGGGLTLDGSGIETFTTNLNYLRAEGVEFGFSFGVDIGRAGSLNFQGNYNQYLTQEFQNSPVTTVFDCVGHYGTSCGGPLPKSRWVQRTTWNFNDLSVSAMWRHMGSVSVEPREASGTFEQFRQIDSYDYIDLYASYVLWDMATISAGIVNVFEEDPPVVGNEAADTSSNSGNTFPSHYDTLGRVFSLGLNVKF